MARIISNKGKKSGKIHKQIIRQESFKDKIEKWCTTNRKIIIGFIIGFSLLFRIGYFLQINGTHLINRHQWEESDMSFFDQWATIISKGNVLSDTVLHPLHGWTKMIADQYFRDHPDIYKKMKQRSGSDILRNPPSKILWDQWYGGKQFHQEPLYAYFLAANYKLFGHDVRFVFLWQMILGIVINVLIYLVARRYFGDFTATLAGVMAIFCGPLIFYDLVLLRSTMTVFFGILLVYLQGLVFDKKKVIWWLLFGSVIGLSLLLQIYYIIFLVMVILLLVVRFRKQTRLLLTYSGCLIAGTIVVMSPAFIRNSIVGAPVFSLNSNGASTFIADNNGTVLNFTGWNANNKIMSDIMGSSGGHILKAIIPTLKTHENPARFLSQLSEKTHALFSWYEIPNNVNFYFFREHSIVLSIAFFNFLLLTPFALVGLILAFMKKKKAVPLYFMIIVQIIPLLGFMVLSRHRVALIPVLIPFAAFTIAELAGSWRGWEKVMIVLGLAILTGLSATPNNEYTIKMAAVDYDSIYNMYYVDSLKKLVDNKEWKAADLLLEDFIEVYEPRVIKNISLTFKCTRIHEAEVYLFFSWIHSIHSQILVPTGDTQGAVNEEHVSARLKDAGNITREMEK